jgi:prolyl-tRNA synthetase
MRRSQLFIKTRRDSPADEEARNAQLLIRAGFVHKEMAGVYSYLPLGMMVLDNIKAIVREEMNVVGGQEMLLSTLQHPQIWKTTDRWDDDKVDVWFKAALGEDSEVGFGWSHEEPMARLMTQFISSYKDLPVYTYQFQNKLRKEVRAKSGLLRAREFIMKDLYSFSRGQEEHERFYEQIQHSYMSVYRRLGIGDITYKTFASGGAFSKFSHEFQTLSPVGEDTIYFHEGEGIAINKEVLTDEVLADLGIKRDGLEEKTAVEVGNIFTFGSRYTEPLGLFFADEKGIQQPVFMGSYGIGVSRLMGLLAEHFADEKGLVWPQAVAPYQIYLANLGDSAEVTAAADKTYQSLTSSGVKVIYDDRDASAGEKFADADLMGIPIRVVISDKTLDGGNAEIKLRTAEETHLMPLDGINGSIEKFLHN